VNGNLRHLETQLTPAYTLSVSHYFDALNSLLSATQNGYTTHYLYAPGGERLATLRPGGATNWTIRGLGNEVLRVFLQDAGDTWRLDRDYIYRGGQLLASEGPEEGKYHYHLDHLGSSRLVTDDTGQHAAFHAYLPFGQEVTPPADSFTKLKYTGHEREEGMDSVRRADDLDYMHARWCSPTAGRFLSVDPVLGRAGNPQSWNRYSYALQNPVVVVDATGRAGVYVVNAFLPAEFSSEAVTDYFDFWSIYQSGASATSKNFTAALRDADGLTIFIGHSNLEDTLYFQNRSQSVNFENFAQTPPGIGNRVVCLATCNSTSILEDLKTRPGQAFIGVTSNQTWQGTTGFVQAGDLAYIAAQFVEGLRNGLTVGQISEALNREFSERSKKNPKYHVTVVVFGDEKAKLEPSGSQP
jgi:RHS repeat-associated protein